MTPEALGRRNHHAMSRIVAACTRIARAIGDPELQPLIDTLASLKRGQDPQVLALRQREAAADLLDAIAKHVPEQRELTPAEEAERDAYMRDLLEKRAAARGAAWGEAVSADLSVVDGQPPEEDLGDAGSEAKLPDGPLSPEGGQQQEESIPVSYEDAPGPAGTSEQVQGEAGGEGDAGDDDELPPPRVGADEASAEQPAPKEEPKEQPKPKRGRNH